MAETILVMPLLFDRLLSAGRELVEALQKKGFPLTAAFWMLDPSELDWKLLLAADGVNSEGQLRSLGKVLPKAPRLPGVYWPSVIRVEDSTSIKPIRSAVRNTYSKNYTGPATVYLKSSSQRVNLFVYLI